MIGLWGLRQLDHILVLVEKEFRPIMNGPDLFTDHQAMRVFLISDNSDMWQVVTGHMWDVYHALMENTMVFETGRDFSNVDHSPITHTKFLDAIDAIYIEIFTDKDTLCVIGNKDYMENMIKYANRCVEAVMRILGIDGNNLSLSLRQVQSKILFVLLDRRMTWFPLVTKSFLLNVHQGLSKYPDTLKEVSHLSPVF
jgi:hypothetical protein